MNVPKKSKVRSVCLPDGDQLELMLIDRHPVSGFSCQGKVDPDEEDSYCVQCLEVLGSPEALKLGKELGHKSVFLIRFYDGWMKIPVSQVGGLKIFAFGTAGADWPISVLLEIFSYWSEQGDVLVGDDWYDPRAWECLKRIQMASV